MANLGRGIDPEQGHGASPTGPLPRPRPQVSAESKFVDLGADSLDTVRWQAWVG